MLKQLFISIEIVHFLFLLYYSTNLHVFCFIFCKLIKFSLILCIKNLKKFSAEKYLYPEINLLESVKGKKNRRFLKKFYFIFCKVFTMASILRIQKKISGNKIFDGAVIVRFWIMYQYTNLSLRLYSSQIWTKIW